MLVSEALGRVKGGRFENMSLGSVGRSKEGKEGCAEQLARAGRKEERRVVGRDGRMHVNDGLEILQDSWWHPHGRGHRVGFGAVVGWAFASIARKNEDKGEDQWLVPRTRKKLFGLGGRDRVFFTIPKRVLEWAFATVPRTPTKVNAGGWAGEPGVKEPQVWLESP